MMDDLLNDARIYASEHRAPIVHQLCDKLEVISGAWRSGNFTIISRALDSTPTNTQQQEITQLTARVNELEDQETTISEMIRSLSGAVGLDSPDFWESINCVDGMKDEVRRLTREKEEAWGIRYCCNGRECGCQGEPIDPPTWWIENQELKRRLAKAQDITALIEEGFLVRSIAGDDEQGWALKILPKIKRLADALEALNEKESPT